MFILSLWTSIELFIIKLQLISFNIPEKNITNENESRAFFVCGKLNFFVFVFVNMKKSPKLVVPRESPVQQNY